MTGDSFAMNGNLQWGHGLDGTQTYKSLQTRPAQAEYQPRDSSKMTNAVRTAVRFPMTLPMHVQTATGLIEVRTDNISSNGILFSGPELPGVDSQIEFTIQMPAVIMGTLDDVLVHCLGRVVRHQTVQGVSQAAAIIDQYFMRA